MSTMSAGALHTLLRPGALQFGRKRCRSELRFQRSGFVQSQPLGLLFGNEGLNYPFPQTTRIQKFGTFKVGSSTPNAVTCHHALPSTKGSSTLLLIDAFPILYRIFYRKASKEILEENNSVVGSRYLAVAFANEIRNMANKLKPSFAAVVFDGPSHVKKKNLAIDKLKTNVRKKIEQRNMVLETATADLSELDEYSIALVNKVAFQNLDSGELAEHYMKLQNLVSGNSQAEIKVREIMRLKNEHEGFVKAYSNIKHYPGYKENRPGLPDPIRLSIPQALELMENVGIKTILMDHEEADDIIGTLVKNFLMKNNELHVQIMSPDKDFYQLIGPQVSILRPLNLRNKSMQNGAHLEVLRGNFMPLVHINESWFASEFDGIKPTSFTDILTLIGDISDNVPGIPKVGKVRAKALIKKFGTVEALMDAWGDGEKRDGFPSYLPAELHFQKDMILLSKQLVTLDCELDIPYELKDLALESEFSDSS